MFDISGGSGEGYEYSFDQANWFSFTTGSQIKVDTLSYGNYLIWAKDNLGNDAQKTVSILLSPTPNLYASVTNNESFYGCFDGSIQIDSISGSKSLSTYTQFVLNDSITSPLKPSYSIDSLCSGSYVLKLLNENGCYSEPCSFEMTYQTKKTTILQTEEIRTLTSSTISFNLNNITENCDTIGRIVISNISGNDGACEYAIWQGPVTSGAGEEIAIDGEQYPIITIGDQNWLGRNLHWDDGLGGIRAYNDDYSIGNEYGYLYNWDAAKRIADKINGWHLPSQGELHQLGVIISEEKGPFQIVVGDDWTGVGGILKEIGLLHWNSPNPASDDYGFNMRGTGGIGCAYQGLKRSAIIWSSTEVSTTNAWSRFFYYADEKFRGHSESKTAYVSVRLLSDNDYSSLQWKPIKLAGDTILIEESGNYNIILKDGFDNYSNESNFNIDIIQALVIDTANQQNVTYYGASDGQITVMNVAGGTEGDKQINLDDERQYTFSGNEILIDNLFAGEHFLLATDIAGCSSDTCYFTITQPECFLELQITNPDPVCYPATVNLTSGSVTEGSELGDAILSYYKLVEEEEVELSFEEASAIDESGIYYIRATSSPDCSVTGPVVVTINPLPVATFSYPGTPYCSNAANPYPEYSVDGEAGIFSSTPGLVFVSKATGQVNLAESIPGTYTVTNIIPASGGCPQVEETGTITVTEPPSATLFYEGSPFCETLETEQPVTITGTPGGTWSATPAGLAIDAGTGTITPGTSVPGTYSVTYTIPASGGCPAFSVSTPVTVTPLPDATFSYPGLPYCSNEPDPYPEFSGDGEAGTFTSTPGLVFVSTTTGQVSLIESIPGTYTVTNTIPASGGCPQVEAMNSITINEPPTVTSAWVTPTTLCGSGSVLFRATASDGIIKWYDAAIGGNEVTPPTIISTTTTLYAEAEYLGCKSTSRVEVTATVFDLPTITSYKVVPPTRCAESGNFIIYATPSSGTIDWYKNEKGGRPLHTGTSFNTPILSKTTTYYLKVNDGSCSNPERMPVTATIIPRPTITYTNSSPVCDKSTVTLSATASSGTVNWYSTSTGASPIGTGTPFTPPDQISENTVFWVEATDRGCVSLSREAVNVNVYPKPTVIVTIPQVEVCSPSIIIDLTKKSITEGSTPRLNYTYWRDADAAIPYETPKKAAIPGIYFIKGATAEGCFDIKQVW
ncbi:MAG: hypothetical protein K9H26_10650 [Prolixibacteraceae bacterium]|nr:hypothetical protein [Prolixibacteraceae bacterium]